MSTTLDMVWDEVTKALPAETQANFAVSSWLSDGYIVDYVNNADPDLSFERHIFEIAVYVAQWDVDDYEIEEWINEFEDGWASIEQDYRDQINRNKAWGSTTKQAVIEVCRSECNDWRNDLVNNLGDLLN